MYRYIIETNSMKARYESLDKAQKDLNGMILAGIEDIMLSEEKWDSSKEFEFAPVDTKVIYSQGNLKKERKENV